MWNELYLAFYVFCLYMAIYYLQIMKYIQPTTFDEKEEEQQEEQKEQEENEEQEEQEEQEEAQEEQEPSSIAT